MRHKIDDKQVHEWETLISINGYRLTWEIPAPSFNDAVERLKAVAEVLDISGYEILRISRAGEDIPF